MINTASFDHLLAHFSHYYQDAVRSHLSDSPLLATALGYHHGWNDATGSPLNLHPGKQIRPLLALLSCAASGAPYENALALAAAIELVHNFSLIHDDIMDNSETRRGRETVWTIWGRNQAINIGDGAYGLSFQLLAESDFAGLDAWMIVHGERMLAKACVDTVTGQIMDVGFETREDVNSTDYVKMVGLKTGPLLGVALGGGALFANGMSEKVKTLENVGRMLGVAFQIQDDILGIWGDPSKTGKANVDDLTQKKKSLPILWALENLPASQAAILSALYSAPAPLSSETTAQIRQLLSEAGVQETVSAQAQRYYLQVVEGIDSAYPPSEYRAALLQVAAMIVNRAG